MESSDVDMNSLGTESPFIEGQFPCETRSQRVYIVRVYKDALRYAPVGSGGSPSKRRVLPWTSGRNDDSRQLLLSDVVGCDCMKGKTVEDTSAYLTVYAYRRAHTRHQDQGKATALPCRKRFTVTLRFCGDASYEKNLQEASLWKTVITCLLQRINIAAVPDLRLLRLPAPPRLLVLLNPFSGPGRALHLFQTRIRPIFAEAGLAFELITTEYAGHARELMRTVDLDEWYGFVVMSGDGLMFEVVNGLMERPDWRQAIKKPLAALPGGSGNALSCAICHDAGESYLKKHELHAAFIVAKHNVVPMDLVAVDTAHGNRLYSFLSVGWGMMADVDIDSEKYRSMGNSRFLFMAIIKIAGMKTYHGHLSYLPAGDTLLKTASSAADEDDAGCGPVPTPLLAPLDRPVPQGWITVEDEFILFGAVYQSHLAKDNLMTPAARLDDGVIHLVWTRAHGASRIGMMQMLASLENGLQVSEGGFVHTAQVRAFRLVPGPDSAAGIMTVDGESVDYGPIQAQVLPSMARVMSIRR